MIKKYIPFLTFAILLSCEPTTNGFPIEVSNNNSLSEEEKPTITTEDSVIVKTSSLGLDLQIVKDKICLSLDEINGFEKFESTGGIVVSENGHAISYGFIEDIHMITFEKLSHRNAEGKAYNKVLDIDSVKNYSSNKQVYSTNFKYKENANDEFLTGFVSIKNDTCDKILKAWKIDFDNNKLIKLDTKDIELTYNWFGYDG